MSRVEKSFTLKSAQFRRERESVWKELETALDRIESGGLSKLSASELHRLAGLYRSTISSLSVARAVSLDRNLLEYLESLSARAYVAVYSVKGRPLETIRSFFFEVFPSSVRRHIRPIAAAAFCMALGVLIGWAMTLADVDRYYDFVPVQVAQGRSPNSSPQMLRDILYSQDDEQMLDVFAAVLFSHNSKVGILSFSLGFAAGIPTAALMTYNGSIIGSMGALYQDHGLGLEFWAWVLPHGVTELLALCLCGGAGFVFGGAVLFPGKRSRLDCLIEKGREAGRIVLGAIVLLAIAAVIEGFFRQLVHSQLARWSVAAFTLGFWAIYFSFMGRKVAANR